jgi:hypothetical protein
MKSWAADKMKEVYSRMSVVCPRGTGPLLDN